MDIYDYNVDHLTAVAGSCRYMNYKKAQRPAGDISGLSCSDCRSWNGSGCTRKQFDSIASDLRLD